MALSTITEIDLDINQPGLAVVHAKQYDTVRQVKAHLFYNGVKWLVPSSNYVAVVGFKKADRIGGFYDTTEDAQTAVTVDNSDRSIIYILLDRNVVTTQGNVNTEITFYDTITQGRLSTFSFVTQVEGATVTELDLASNPYFNVLAEDIRAVLEAESKLTGLSAEATKLAPNANPTVTVTGGTSADDPYVFHLGIPSMPSITVSATGRASGASPTATITGGTTAGQAYNIAFGIPKGDIGPVTTISSSAYAYALSTSGTVVPTSGWQTSLSALGTPSTWQGKFLWSRVIVTFDNSETLTYYAVAYCGIDGTGSPGTAAPLMDGTASAGSATAYSRQDHVHPTDTSRASKYAVLQGTVQTVSANGTSSSITLTGLTANHVVGNWGMFTDSACTTPIPENAPTCDVSITTAANSWTYTITNYTETFYLRPTFVLKQN